MNFQDRLKNVREARGLTQGELADILGVTRPTISGYETKGTQPDYEKLIKLSNVLNVSIDYLVSGNKELVDCNIQVSVKRVNREFNQLFRDLSPKEKTETIAYMKYLKHLTAQGTKEE